MDRILEEEFHKMIAKSAETRYHLYLLKDESLMHKPVNQSTTLEMLVYVPPHEFNSICFMVSLKFS